GLKSGRPPCGGRTKVSPSRFRFRPPRPTGPSPRDCSLFVRPLGRGFDLLAFRAWRKEEPMRTPSPDQDLAETILSQFASGSLRRAIQTLSSPPANGRRSNQP